MIQCDKCGEASGGQGWSLDERVAIVRCIHCIRLAAFIPDIAAAVVAELQTPLDETLMRHCEAVVSALVASLYPKP